MGTFEEYGVSKPIQSEQDLIGRIIEASAWISETLAVFDRVLQSLHRRLKACIGADGRHFEKLM